jgi:hypothetical protein
MFPTETISVAPGASTGAISVDSSFFAKEVQDLALQKVTEVVAYSNPPARSATNISFYFPPFKEPYCLDLSQTTVIWKGKICKANGDVPDDDTVVAPCQFLPLTIFKSFKITVGNQQITTQIDDYPQKAITEYTLRNSASIKLDKGRSQCCHEETAGELDNCLFDRVSGRFANEGFGERLKMFATVVHVKQADGTFVSSIKWSETKGVGHFISEVYHDLDSMRGMIPPGTGVRFDMVLNTSAFMLMADSPEGQGCKLVTEDIVLKVTAKKLSATLFETLLAGFADSKIITYPFLRREIYPRYIPKGSKEVSIDDLNFGGRLPQKMVVYFTKSDASEGIYAKNPFNRLQTFRVENEESSVISIEATINGDNVDHLVPEGATQLEFTMMSFYRFLRFSGQGSGGEGLGITYRQFENLGGSFYYILDFSTRGNCMLENLTPSVRVGSLRLKVRFTKALPCDINMYMFNEFNSVLTINKLGQVSVNYAT